MIVTPRFRIAMALMALGACRPSGPTADSGPLVRDSAGVRIVENVAPAWSEGSGWRLSDQPVLEIGVLEGEAPYMFRWARGARRLPDGSLIVLDGGTSQLRFFDGIGRHLRSVGGVGEGPGEFRSASSVAYGPADSLVVWDVSARRASVFSVQGEFGRTVFFSLPPETPESVPRPDRRPEFAGVFSNGDLFASMQPILGPGEVPIDEGWSFNVLMRYSAEGDEATELARVEVQQCDPAESALREDSCAPPAYGAVASFRLHGDRIYVSRPDRNEIRVLDSSGRLQTRIHGADPPAPVTAAMRREFRDAAITAIDQIVATQPTRPDEIRQMRESLQRRGFAEVVPAFSRVIVAEDGHIWAEEHRLDRGGWFTWAFQPRTYPVRWTVFDPDGVQLGDVMVPAEFSIQEIGADYVLGMTLDDLEVERVRMYAILKP